MQQTKQVVVQGLLTNYIRQGKGKTILLLHGWGDSAHGMDSLAKHLAESFDVITPDLPGFGDSEAPHTPWGLDNYADHIHGFLQKLQIEVFAIVGHSNGGAIALRGLATNKIGTDKLVLLASAGIRGEYKGRIKVLRLITKAGKAVTKPLPKSAQSKLRKTVYSSVGSDMLVAEHLQETFKKVVTDDVRNDAKRIYIPTLIIYGADDKATPPAYGKIFHESIAGSQLELINGAGHFVHLDEPQVVIKQIVGFLT